MAWFVSLLAEKCVSHGQWLQRTIPERVLPRWHPIPNPNEQSFLFF
jgi:hypothetical protein